MVDDTSSTREKPLTFFGVTLIAWTLYSLSWGVLVASVKAWWRGGGTVNIQATGQPKGSADTVSESLNLHYTNATISVTVTRPLRHVTAR